MAFEGPFTVPPAAAIASFDYDTISDGTATKKFYLAHLSGLGNILTQNVIYTFDSSTPTAVTLTGTVTSGAPDEYNFDLPAFQFPKTVTGTVIVTLGMFLSEPATDTITVTFRLLKYDGSAETALCTAQTIGTKTGIGGDEGVYSYGVAVTETHFARGEVLRLEVVFTQSASGTGTYELGVDPQDRDGTNLTPSTDATITNSHIYVQFRPDELA